MLELRNETHTTIYYTFRRGNKRDMSVIVYSLNKTQSSRERERKKAAKRNECRSLYRYWYRHLDMFVCMYISDLLGHSTNLINYNTHNESSGWCEWGLLYTNERVGTNRDSLYSYS